MKLSTRSRYGLRAVVDIASFGEEECVSLNNIASRIGVSENYLEQIFIRLRKAGILKSIRGAQGGYMLSKPADSITVGEVLVVLEGSLYPVDCLDESMDCSCGEGSCDPCVTKPVWEKIYNSISTVVDSITLKDLVEERSDADMVNPNTV